jgi:hypothetical protein
MFSAFPVFDESAEQTHPEPRIDLVLHPEQAKRALVPVPIMPETQTKAPAPGTTYSAFL